MSRFETNSAGKPVYLDNHATTRPDPRVVEAMMPFLTEAYGNAASRTHGYGWEAEEAVEAAREEVAAVIGARPREIVFTSGATESDNLAIKGLLDFQRERGRHIVTVETEHKAVLDTCRRLERSGRAEVTYLKPRGDGLLALDDVARALRPDTVLLSVMHANSEIGVLQPIAEIGAIARDAGVLFHTDAAQSVGKVPVDVDAMRIDLLSMSAHKLYGPKGCGALFVRGRDPRVRLTPTMDGGGQERGLRAGTVNVPGVVGLGAACRLASEDMTEEAARILGLRERLRRRLEAELDEIRFNGDLERRLPGNLNVSFACVEGEALLMSLKDVALSSGSACTSASLEPSHVLRAIGLRDDLAHGSIRFGIGRFNDEREIDYVAERVILEVRRLREQSPVYRKLRDTRRAEAARSERSPV
jgi:cysteine desulfurase